MQKDIHTFVICAYGESPYIRECIESIMSQSVKSRVLLTTSTPNEYLEGLCIEFGIDYHIRNASPSIGDDWNEAFRIAETEYVTIAHQDDIYEPEYTRKILSGATGAKKYTNKEPVIIFTDYYELVNGEKRSGGLNLNIKKTLLFPLRSIRLSDKKTIKRGSLRLGNSICCPSVTYNKTYIEKLMSEDGRSDIFSTDYKSNLDWDAWEWLSSKEGVFVYIPKLLISHRIHSNSETSSVIEEGKRTNEDLVMFSRFWPRGIAGILTKVYRLSEKSNNRAD
ncbi:MAG: glycosyltransferase family 2 protein [Eubacterium sp.]|nr:glycosyltransferase family 2 protein [Eubacterium sp.]